MTRETRGEFAECVQLGDYDEYGYALADVGDRESGFYWTTIDSAGPTVVFVTEPDEDGRVEVEVVGDHFALHSHGVPPSDVSWGDRIEYPEE